MGSQFNETGPQAGYKGCSNCTHRGPSGWEPNGACRTCTGYHGGYPNWKADQKTLAGYIEAINESDKIHVASQKTTTASLRKMMDECHLGDSKLNVTPVPTNEYDIVSKPKHYMLFEEEGIEVRDVIEKLVTKMYYAFCDDKGTIPDSVKAPLFDCDYVQMMQYLMRFMDKNGKQDLEKAKWYLDKLVASY